MHVLTVDYRAANAPELFAKSLKETGFAVISNHPLLWSNIEQAYKEWHAFFNSEQRHQYPFDPKTQDGYIPSSLSETAKGNNVKDIKEFYHLYFPNGRYPKELSNVTKQNFNDIFALGKILLSWIEQQLPAEIRQNLHAHLSDIVSMERTLYRILYYPPLTGTEAAGAIRAAAHEDINLITLLPAATDSGLQVKDVKGNWHEVQVNPETLVVNVGDMLQEATQHYYRSTTHRVVNPQGEQSKRARLSMPVFVHPKADAYLSERYPTAEGYLNERLRELGLMM